jgi:hypothetical protein
MSSAFILVSRFLHHFYQRYLIKGGEIGEEAREQEEKLLVLVRRKLAYQNKPETKIWNQKH